MTPRSTVRVFEETAVHDEWRPLRKQEVRLADTIAMVPPGTRSVVDVGCGTGELLHRLDVPIRFGTDLATRGIRRVRVPVARASILQLPFADASFDLVICAETLEHLDPADLVPAAHELYRVARRHVLVTVPNREDLLTNSHKCERCGTVFHLHGHQSSLGPEDIRVLFPEAARFEVRGSWRQRPYNRALLRLRTEVFGLWKYAQYAVCPACGNQELRNDERRLLYRLFGAVNMLLNPRKSRENWLLVLVEKP